MLCAKKVISYGPEGPSRPLHIPIYSHFHCPYLRLSREGMEVHAACGAVRQLFPEADEVIHLPLEKKMTAPANWAAAGRLRLETAKGYALIITHTSLAAFFTGMAVKGMKGRPKVINMVHGYLFDDDMAPVKRTVLRTAEQLVAGETDLLLTMNRADLNLAHRYRLGKEIGSVPGGGFFPPGWDLQGTGPGAAGPVWSEAGGLRTGLCRGVLPQEPQAVLIRAMADLPERVRLSCRERARCWRSAGRWRRSSG